MSVSPKMCSGCGAPLSDGAVFCSNCGTKMPATGMASPSPVNTVPAATLQTSYSAPVQAVAGGVSSIPVSAPVQATPQQAVSTNPPATPYSAPVPVAPPAAPSTQSGSPTYIPPVPQTHVGNSPASNYSTPPVVASSQQMSPPLLSSADGIASTPVVSAPPQSTTGQTVRENPAASPYSPPASVTPPANTSVQGGSFSYAPPAPQVSPGNIPAPVAPPYSGTAISQPSTQASPSQATTTNHTQPYSGYAPPPSYMGGYGPVYPPQPQKISSAVGQQPHSYNGGGYSAAPPPSNNYPTPPAAQPPVPQNNWQTPAPPPKKKLNPVVIVLIIVAALAVIGLLSYFVLNKLNEDKTQQIYSELVSNITDADSPADVTRYETELASFAKEYPDILEQDLQLLMDASIQYEDADEDEDRYLDMLSDLESLRSSDNKSIASCSKTLISLVNEEYDAYIESIEPDIDIDPNGGNGPNGNEDLPSLQIYENIELTTLVGGEEGVGVSVINNSDKTIVYFEVLILYYDELDAPTVGSDGTNWDVIIASGDDVNIAPGAKWTSDEYGYWEVWNGVDASHAYGIVNYIEYSDNTYEGLDYGTTSDVIFEEYVAIFKEYLES